MLSRIFPIKLIVFYISGSGFRADFLFLVTTGATTPVKVRSMRGTSGCNQVIADELLDIFVITIFPCAIAEIVTVEEV